MSILITFEGIDGSGKSTQAKRLKERIERSGRSVELFREPGGTHVSERIRSMLLDPQLDIDPFAELLLFSAARAQLCAERIRPLLGEGVIVLLDRFYDSSTAYQGAGRQIAEPEWLARFHPRVTQGLIPTRTYLVKVDPLIAAQRQGSRDPDGQDRMEQAGSEFFRRVAAAYDRLAEAEPRFMTLDGHASIDELHTIIWDDASRLIGTVTTPSGTEASSTTRRGEDGIPHS